VSIDRRLLDIDWVLLGTSVLLSAIGLAVIGSAAQQRRATTAVHLTAGPAEAQRPTPPAVSPRSRPWLRQAGWIGVGLLGLALCVSVDYRRLADRAPLLYLVAVLALAGVLLFGPRIAGTRRWFTFGPVQVQPSEAAKLVAAVVAARILAESRKETPDLRDVVGPGAAIGILALLIAAEPDLGTAFCLLPLFLVVVFLAGLRGRAFATLFLALLLSGGLAWTFAKEYQKQRVNTYVARYLRVVVQSLPLTGERKQSLYERLARYVDPKASDLKGAAYQSRQSRIAVGSGGLLGRGYRRGSQSQLGYLPARQTDFIFSVLAEEQGFLGVLVVLFLYLVLLWRAFETGHRARDRLGAFLASGLASILAFQVIYNVGMVAGLLPVKGLPLPFLSYGGSSILFSYAAVGLILNVRMRRFAN
jgi:rod shape determining protein RodA